MSDSFFTVYRTASWSSSFPLWGRTHLMWLGGFAVLLLIVLPLYARAGEKARRVSLCIMTGLLAADELFKHGMLLRIGEEDVDYLPLHLCSVGLFFCLWYAVHPDRWAGELLFAVSLPGAAVALLFPGWSILPPESFLTIPSFTFHMLLCLIPLCLLASGEIRPDARRLWFCALFLAVTAVPIRFLDKKWGTNFYFLNFAGTGNPLSWFEDRLGNPGYLVGLPICIAVLWGVMYGILALIRAARKQKRSLCDPH